MNRNRLWLISAVWVGVGLAMSSSGVSANDPPNIVVLFSDDAGYADFGFQPNVRDDYRDLTPRIDSIAKAGCRFTNAYMSASVCSPSRAGLMTGRYQQRFGHDNNIPPGYMKGGLPLTETMMSTRLQQAGYQTGLIGKWHLGYPDDYHPNRRGFDYFYGCLQGSRKYFPIENVSPHRVFLENDQPTEEGGYVTDRIGDAACEFISKHRDQAFFLFVSFTAPHGPLQAKPEHLDKLTQIGNERRRKNAGLIVSLDENVGKILDCLDDLDLVDKTLVVFTNDNGGQTQYAANNSPLRGRKGQLWEGGIRVPMAMRWPGRIEPETVIDDPVISLDLLPTFLAAGDHRIDPDWQLDGIDLNQRLTGAVDALPARTLFWRRRGPTGQIAARKAEWKVILDRARPDASPELFNLSQDIAEARNVAEQFPERTSELINEIQQWESGLGTPQWGTNQ